MTAYLLNQDLVEMTILIYYDWSIWLKKSYNKSVRIVQASKWNIRCTIENIVCRW